jgi:hypothetical protein
MSLDAPAMIGLSGLLGIVIASTPLGDKVNHFFDEQKLALQRCRELYDAGKISYRHNPLNLHRIQSEYPYYF